MIEHLEQSCQTATHGPHMAYPNHFLWFVRIFIPTFINFNLKCSNDIRKFYSLQLRNVL